MGEALYKQSLSLLYNPEKVSLPIPFSEYTFNISCVDKLGGDAVGFPHCHESDIEIYYMLEGVLEIIVEDTTYTLNEQDYLIVASGVVHHTIYDPFVHNQYFVIVFNISKNNNVGSKIKNTPTDGLSDLPELLERIQRVKYYLGKDYYHLSDIINLMDREASMQHLGWKTILYNYYIVFTLAALRNVAGAGKQFAPIVSEVTAVRINRYLNAHYNENISLQDVADAFFCSTRHINRVFKRYFNSSFGKTLSRYRVNYAKNYLIETDLNIGAIAELVGVSTPNTLFRLFKEQEGITPGEYRSIHKEKFRSATSINK